MRSLSFVALVALFLALAPARPVLAQCEMPNMMILLDRSGSMGSTCEPPNSKWADARSAISYILSNYGTALQFGLDMFPSDDGCGTGLVYVDVNPNTSTAILNQIDGFPPAADCYGLTPMSASLASLNRYRQLKDPNRRNFIMLISDGADTCAGNPTGDPVLAAGDLLAGGVKTYVIGFGTGAVPAVLTATAQAGGTGNYFQANNQTQLQAAMDQIVADALVEVCDDKDNNCNNQIDEPWPNKGQLCQTQVGLCTAQGVWICNAAQNGLVCDAHVSSSPEVCDGQDNDCDGDVDEDFADVDSDGHTTCTDCCDSGSEAMTGCSVATRPAIHPGAVELCNGYDDDCNGIVDESDPQLNNPCGDTDEGVCEYGHLMCLNGALSCVGEVIAGAEVLCDDLDNDCDGDVDEGEGLEICDDGLDNDCDGLTDSWDDDCGGSCFPGQMKSCGTDTGDCVAGVQVCDENNVWGPCEGGYAGSEEICDGRDNDCDGQIDQDDVCSSAQDCTPGETRDCGVDTGECRMGLQTCTSQGVWSECAGAIDPLPEWCDGRDNDCDGLVDEGDLCDGYEICLCGQCAPPCSAGECPSGNFTCRYDWCVADACCGVHCPAGLECEEHGNCVDRCVVDDIQCPAGQDCRMGICVAADCYSAGNECPQGQLCRDGVCVADPCFGVDCPVVEYCRQGLCEGVACAQCTAGQVCVLGQCQDSLCAGVDCGPGQVCRAGDCVGDPCQGVECPLGSSCSEGTCIADPCANVICPVDSSCEDGYCVADPTQQTDGGPDGTADGAGDADGASLDADAGPDGGGDVAADGSVGDQDADGGSGGDVGGGSDDCGCAAGRTSGSLWLLLAGLGLAWRRRVR